MRKNKYKVLWALGIDEKYAGSFNLRKNLMQLEILYTNKFNIVSR